MAVATAATHLQDAKRQALDALDEARRSAEKNRAFRHSHSFGVGGIAALR